MSVFTAELIWPTLFDPEWSHWRWLSVQLEHSLREIFRLKLNMQHSTYMPNSCFIRSNERLRFTTQSYG